MSSSAATPQGGGQGRGSNALLARLPPGEYPQVAAYLHPVELSRRDPIYELGGSVEAVYFPLDAVVSLVTSADGHTVEVATVGNEGMVGLPTFLGSSASPHTAFCQVPGRVLWMSTPALEEVLTEAASLGWLLRLYAQATLVQLSQNVACNRLHLVEQRAARWLLTTHDRVGRDDFELTQNFLAQMLGVRRATVSETATSLQDRGLISYRYGKIAIRDRARLEEVTCGCYEFVRDEIVRLLGARR